MVPTACPDCGNIRILYREQSLSSPCAYCQTSHVLSLSPDQPAYLIFLSLVERLKPQISDGQLYEIEPTTREYEFLRSGDQLVDFPTIWRVLGKKKHPYNLANRMFLTLRPSAQTSITDGDTYISALPPFIDFQTLNLSPTDYIISHRYMPIAIDTDRNNLLLVGFGDAAQRQSLTDLFPHWQLTFWRTSRSAFQQAYRAYFANYPVRGCNYVYDPPCAEQWHLLEPTDSIDVRYCQRSHEHIYLLSESDPHTELHVQCWNKIAKFSERGIISQAPNFSDILTSRAAPDIDPFDL